MEHFGIKLINRGKSFRLTRDEFAIVNTKLSLPRFEDLEKRNAYNKEKLNEYSEVWCSEYRELCLKNFDLNIEYFAKLDAAEFNKALETFLVKYKQFEEIADLKVCAGIEGFYIMVLGDYKQVYIGKAVDIKRRIMQHWTKVKSFDRTLFPMYAWDKSIFSIDFFRALDTTRIFVWKRNISDGIEARMIKDFPSQFSTNRVGGDVTSPIEALATMKTRCLDK